MTTKQDRPELRHKIREILRVVNGIRNFGMGTAYNEYVDKILTLFPDEEEAVKQAEKKLLISIGKETKRMDGTTYLTPDYSKYRQALKEAGIEK